jgi:hypothetical protein
MPDLIRHPVFSMDSGFRRNDKFKYLVAGLIMAGAQLALHFLITGRKILCEFQLSSST